MIEEALIALTPVEFFQLRLECSYLEKQKNGISFLKSDKRYLLPKTSALCNEEQFADVSMGWNEDGLFFTVLSKRPYKQSMYPSVERGDSFEVFIDTRDVKTASFNTRFCHHFFCLPEDIEGIQAGEITRFRTEDKHDLCDPNELSVRSDLLPKGYSLQFHIPAHCLHGYDPEQFNRLGMTYRINTLQGEQQHFSVSSNDFNIDQQPSLWSSVRLVK